MSAKAVRSDPQFDLTIAVNYYEPYMSGLTKVAQSIAKGLAARDWRVAVVASRHDRTLPKRERADGVDVFRCPIITRIGRGVVSPAFPFVAGRIARRSRVVNLHLPMLEAALVAMLAGRTPLVSNHHDDVWLPGGLTARFQVSVVDHSVAGALRASTGVVVNNVDHAQHSRHWPIMQKRQVTAIPPPCQDRSGGKPTFRDGPGTHVGFLGRIAPEKGLEYLLDGFRRNPDPDSRLLIAGDYLNVAGGGVLDELRSRAGGDPRIRFLGFLTDDEVRDFYASIDVFALTSVAEESFGIAQAEAMMAGVPAVAPDLPGVRQPVTTTGFGRLVPARDPAAVEAALRDLAAMPPGRRVAGRDAARGRFGIRGCLDAYEEVFRSIAAEDIPGGRT